MTAELQKAITDAREAIRLRRGEVLTDDDADVLFECLEDLLLALKASGLVPS